VGADDVGLAVVGAEVGSHLGNIVGARVVGLTPVGLGANVVGARDVGAKVATGLDVGVHVSLR
jgi:hypothetical protein